MLARSLAEPLCNKVWTLQFDGAVSTTVVKVHRKWLLIQQWEVDLPLFVWLWWPCLKMLLNESCIILQSIWITPDWALMRCVETRKGDLRGIKPHKSIIKYCLYGNFFFSVVQVFWVGPFFPCFIRNPVFINGSAVYLISSSSCILTCGHTGKHLQAVSVTHWASFSNLTAQPVNTTPFYIVQFVSLQPQRQAEGYLQSGSCWAGGVRIKKGWKELKYRADFFNLYQQDRFYLMLGRL